MTGASRRKATTTRELDREEKQAAALNPDSKSAVAIGKKSEAAIARMKEERKKQAQKVKSKEPVILEKPAKTSGGRTL